MNVIDKIVAEAKREDAEAKRRGICRTLDKRNEGKIAKNMLIFPHVCSNLVDIRDIPISYNTFVNKDPHVFATHGFYSIQYVPSGSRKRIKDKPFVIGQDLVHIRVTVSGPAHWKCLATRIPELGWLYRNSTLTKDLFGIAKKHPGIPFCFTVDWVKYADMITKKSEEQNIDIDNKPFVTFKCSSTDERYMNDTRELCEKKDRNFYAQEIIDAEKEMGGIDDELE